MNLAEFIAKWRRVELTERSAAQQHFLDLCELLDHPKPAEVDPRGDFFTFEKGAAKRGGSEGWADVWKKGYFAWEYKGRHKDLSAAYVQLDQYRAALDNPPLLVTCDMDRLVVHTNFTDTRQEVHELRLEELGEPRNLEILRAVFFAPHKLRPGATSEAITTEAARKVGELAVALRDRGLDPHEVAHFLDRVVFSFFAEDIGLLPDRLLTKLLEKSRRRPRAGKGEDFFTNPFRRVEARYVVEPDARGIGTVRYPRLVARDDEAAGQLARRTLTNLYNQRPAWLEQAHRRLDEAVFAAYGWPADLADDEVLARLLALNLERAAESGAPPGEEEASDATAEL